MQSVCDQVVSEHGAYSCKASRHEWTSTVVLLGLVPAFVSSFDACVVVCTVSLPLKFRKRSVAVVVREENEIHAEYDVVVVVKMKQDGILDKPGPVEVQDSRVHIKGSGDGEWTTDGQRCKASEALVLVFRVRSLSIDRMIYRETANKKCPSRSWTHRILSDSLPVIQLVSTIPYIPSSLCACIISFCSPSTCNSIV
jgi:hypothetical protein